MRRFTALLALFLLLAPSFPLDAASRRPLRGRKAMVASVSEIASQVGADTLRRGGNAIDAAVAVGFALAVTWPSAGNLGGGGFMLIRKADGSVEAIDYRERAPLAASRDMYLGPDGSLIKDASTVGGLASGVPGTVAGLALVHERHGRLKWHDLIEPARKLAAEGFIVSESLERSLRHKPNAERLSKFDESRRIFLRDGRFYEEGERFVQPDLARTLARIRDRGAAGFYTGETARLIVEEMKATGGIITMEDLAGYRPTLREPLRGTYRGLEIVTMPPPSSGGVALIEMLNMLEHYDLASMGPGSARTIHLLVEVMRRAFADRAVWLGDADFARVPVAGLISKAYAAELVKTIDPEAAGSSTMTKAGEPWPYESEETTHFTIVDAEGNAVSNTYTINDSYGSGVTVRGAGFLMNDEMDDFTSKPGVPNAYGLIQGEANAIAPQKRPLSSMTPAFVVRDGKLWFAIGSPGGPKIINTVLQTIVNVVDFGMSIQEAIDAPRVHHQWMPDLIYWERNGVNGDTRAILERMGHRFREKSENMGDAHGVLIEENGARRGASDPRLGGVPAGY